VHPSKSINISQLYDGVSGAIFWPFRLPARASYRQYCGLPLRRVQGVLSTSRNCTSRGCSIPPATNDAEEHLVHTLKQALPKSQAPLKVALQEFLQLYRRTPLARGYSHSQLLNGRTIRTYNDRRILPSATQTAQKRQMREESSPLVNTDDSVQPTAPYVSGQPCYARVLAPRGDRDPKWVPGIVTKVCGSRHAKGPSAAVGACGCGTSASCDPDTRSLPTRSGKLL